MNYIKYLLILCVTFFATVYNGYGKDAETQWHEAERINISNGLPHNGVTDILKDSRGYLWFATYDGLSRYNSYQHVVYKNTISKNYFPTNRIRILYEDRLSRIWIGTDNGVVVYNYTDDNFITLETPKDNLNDTEHIIRSIHSSSDGSTMFCISESSGIKEYNEELKLICNSLYPEKFDVIESICLDKENLLLASSKGLILFNTKTKYFKKVLETEIKQCHSIDLFNSKLIVAAVSTGFVKIDFKIENGEYLFSSSNVLYSHIKLKSINVDDNHGLWLGGQSDGVIYIPDIINDIDKNYRFAHDSRISTFLCKSNSETLVGTFDSGIISLIKKKEIFKTSKHKFKMPRILFLGNDKLLIRSPRSAAIFDIKTEKSKKLEIGNKPSRITIDKDGLIWSFGINDMFKYDLRTKKKTPLNNITLLNLMNEIPSLAEFDNYGNLWLGYKDNLYRVILDEDKNVSDLESIHTNALFDSMGIEKIRVIYSDPLNKNVIWIGSDVQGLFKIELRGENTRLRDAKIKHFIHNTDVSNSLPSNFVSSIIRNIDSTLWIGTEQGGICRAQETEEGEIVFKSYNESSGLSNDVVKAIQTDEEGNLWIGTNNGLNVFNTKTEKFRIYRSSDGLPFDDFFYYSTKNSDGIMCFCSTTGICYFNPSSLPKKESLPVIFLTHLKVYDNIVKRNAELNEPIKLKHNDHVFSIGLDVLYDDKASSHYYHYILEPINKKWTTAPIYQNEIKFNGLEAGRYKLRVKASNSFADETEEQVIDIIIPRPFRTSVFAIILYIIIVLVIFSYIARMVINNKTLKYKVLFEHERVNYLTKTNNEKQRYFSNISHELKTPLTLILAPVIMLQERFKLDKDIRNKLDIIQRQSKKMLHLIELAHKAQQSEDNTLVLSKSAFLVREFLKDICSDFNFLANYDNKSFTVEYPDYKVRINADFSLLENTINNILNNAFKHTRPLDKIKVKYEVDSNNVIISISDTGYGISEKDLPHIFERFYTSKEENSPKVRGTGIGMAFSKSIVELHGGTISVDSKLNEGTTFTITLPVVEEKLTINPDEKFSNTEVNGLEEPLIIGDLDNEELKISPEFSDCLVYVVDDNGEIRSFLSDLVSPFVNVRVFSLAQECLEAMNSEWPDLIISDVMMPDMEGDEMCRIIKSNLMTSHIPIILLTARFSVDDKISGLAMGADSYIGKPFYPKHLITRIESLLKGRQHIKDRFQSGLPLKQMNLSGVSEKDTELLSILYQKFEENLDNDELEISNLAPELGLNRSLFFSKIKALTDISPYELLKNYRLQRAAELLSDGKHNVSEVCDLTGFKSRTHFSRSFKEKYNVSPSKFGKNIEE